MSSPVTPSQGTSSEPSADNDDPDIGAACHSAMDAARSEPVPEPLRLLAAELAKALDRRQRDLADPDASED